ncbi:MAG: 30S ribosomal protein S20 [Spirochaetales bacterium]|nr:30S ribosomal protein S20 [Spirochaetales bacterium]
MANIKANAKSARRDAKRRIANRAAKSKCKTAIKQFTVNAQANNKEEAEVAFRQMVKLLDTAAGKGLYHKKTVARKKSRMAKLLNQISA